MKPAVRHADEHESATTDISCLRMDDRQRKSRSNRCIDGVATLLHDLHSGITGQRMDAHHHRFLCMGRVHARCCRRANSHAAGNEQNPAD